MKLLKGWCKHFPRLEGFYNICALEHTLVFLACILVEHVKHVLPTRTHVYKIALRSIVVGSSGLCRYPSSLKRNKLIALSSLLCSWLCLGPTAIALLSYSGYLIPKGYSVYLGLYRRAPYVFLIEAGVPVGTPILQVISRIRDTDPQPRSKVTFRSARLLQVISRIRDTDPRPKQKVWLTPLSLVCLLLGLSACLTPML